MHTAALAFIMATAWPGSANPLPMVMPEMATTNDSPLRLTEWCEINCDINGYGPTWTWPKPWLDDFAAGAHGDIDIMPTPSGEPFNVIAGLTAFNSRMAMRDARLAKDEPVPRNSTWATGESVKVPVYGDVFVFSSVDAGSESVEEQHLRWATKAGVGVKVDPWLLEPVQVRGGRTLSYDDAERPARTTAPVPEHTELFIDVSTKLPVPILGRPVNVEYSGTTPPATTPAERPRLNQDVKLAVPIADGQSKVSVGARLAREETPTQTPWFDRAQLYLGLELKH